MLQLPFSDGVGACGYLLHQAQDRYESPPRERCGEAGPARFPMRSARFLSKPACLRCTTEERQRSVALDHPPLGRTSDRLIPADPKFQPHADAARVTRPQVERSKRQELRRLFRTSFRPAVPVDNEYLRPDRVKQERWNLGARDNGCRQPLNPDEEVCERGFARVEFSNNRNAQRTRQARLDAAEGLNDTRRADARYSLQL